MGHVTILMLWPRKWPIWPFYKKLHRNFRFDDPLITKIIFSQWLQYCLLLKIMLPFLARLIVAPQARGRYKVTVSVFLNSGGSCWFLYKKYIQNRTDFYQKISKLLNQHFLTSTSSAGLIFLTFSLFFLVKPRLFVVFFTFLFSYFILHGQMHIRGFIPYFCGLMISLGKKLVHVVPSGSPYRLLDVSQS